MQLGQYFQEHTLGTCIVFGAHVDDIHDIPRSVHAFPTCVQCMHSLLALEAESQVSADELVQILLVMWVAASEHGCNILVAA